MLLSKNRVNRNYNYISGPILGILCFIIIASISELNLVAFNSPPWVLDSLKSFSRILLSVPVMIYIVSQNLNIKKEILIGAVYSILIALFQHFYPLWIQTENRSIAGFSHPNFFAFYLTVGLSILLFDKSLLINKKLKMVLTPIFFITIYNTGTRSAMTLAIIIILIWLWGFNYRFKKTYIILPFINAFSILMIFIQRDKIKSYFSNTRFGFVDENLGSYYWRKLRWEVALKERKTDFWHSLFGNGWGSASYPNDIRFYGTAVHNEYIRLFVETGVLGILIILLLIFYLIFKFHPRKYDNYFLGYAIILIIVVGMYVDNLFVSAETLMLFLFLSTQIKEKKFR
jgi:O-antigen ligase